MSGISGDSSDIKLLSALKKKFIMNYQDSLTECHLALRVQNVFIVEVSYFISQ